jgi:SMC interacting uncharacterized protein involved in chromosome segregation
MPKEIYKKNIKKLDKEIKSTSEKISKLQKNSDEYYKKNTGKTVADKNTMKQFEKIVKERPQLIELAKKNVKAKRLKRKNENLLFIENLRPKTGIGSRLKKYDKLTKAERKGLL